MANTYNISPQWNTDAAETIHGVLPPGDDDGITTDLVAWEGFEDILERSVTAGRLFSTDIVSTYSLVYTVAAAYIGGVLAPNGDIHFIISTCNIGQKVSAAGVVSTYSLVYTQGGFSYAGGVLAPNGDIHFVPESASVGQKIHTMPAVPFDPAVCLSPFLNKF